MSNDNNYTNVVVIADKPASSTDHQHQGQRPLDMFHRDPLKIHDPSTFKIAWEDIFAEPHPGVFSFNWAWSASYTVFNVMRLWTYRILSICGIVSACCFGCQFGCEACYIIWCWTPALKLCLLQLGMVKQIIAIVIDVCITPYIKAWSMMFWNIRVTVVRNGDGSPA